MSHWNYRVIHDPDDGSYCIHEVYYDSDNHPKSWTEKSSSPYGESLQELKNDLEYMSKALTMPVLTIEDERLVPLTPLVYEDDE